MLIGDEKSQIEAKPYLIFSATAKDNQISDLKERKNDVEELSGSERSNPTAISRKKRITV